jgi:hypothetical protein
MSSSYEDSTLDEEWDLSKEEDNAMILALHARHWPKHGGFVLGPEMLQRKRFEGNNKLM